jgi:hypothetical protein
MEETRKREEKAKVKAGKSSVKI